MTQATISLGLILVVLLICFPGHELAHAVVADKLGDPTPRKLGRISLNPAVHLSLVGSVMFMLFGIGWATTPIDPSRLRGRQHISHALVAVAGPLANLAIGIVLGLIIRVARDALPLGPISTSTQIFLQVGLLAVLVNFQLFFFNLLPVPPLDGWTILKGLLPWQWHDLIAKIEPYASYALIALFFLGSGFLSEVVIRPAVALMRLVVG